MTHSGAGSGQPGCASPSMYSSISRPFSSVPRAWGASNPAFSRNRSSAWTAGVHGPARRLTVSPTRVASLMFPPMKGSSFTATGSGELDVAERLRGVEVPGRSRVLRPPPHPLREAFASSDLALVRSERGDLPIDRARDVEPDVRVARPEEERAGDAVVLQAADQLLGKEEVVARRDHAIEPAPSRDAVVGVDLVVAPRVICEDHIGPVLADGQADFGAQPHRPLELAVLVPEEDELFHANRFAGRALLALPRLGHPLRR